MDKIRLAACLAVTGLVSMASASQAIAATFDFSYTFNSGVVAAGRLVGEIDSSDSNIVNVTGLEDFVTVDGVSTGVSFTRIDSASNYSYGTGEAPIVSFDGSILNLFFCDTGSCSAIMTFNKNVPSAYVEAGLLGGGISASIDHPMNNSWSLTAIPSTAMPSVVPLPAALPLFLAAFGGLGLVGRRRKAA